MNILDEYTEYKETENNDNKIENETVKIKSYNLECFALELYTSFLEM